MSKLLSTLRQRLPLIYHFYMKGVSHERSIKSRGFSLSTSDFPTWNVDKVGWERIQTNPSTVAMLRGQKLIIRRHPE
jgi:hypothetical protein